jgi:hypothetical protein
MSRFGYYVILLITYLCVAIIMTTAFLLALLAAMALWEALT